MLRSVMHSKAKVLHFSLLDSKLSVLLCGAVSQWLKKTPHAFLPNINGEDTVTKVQF